MDLGQDSGDDLDTYAMLGASNALAMRRAMAPSDEDEDDAPPEEEKRYPGSLPGRRPNKNRDFSVGVDNILRDYFGLNGNPPVYDEKDFERRFRVPRVVFDRIYKDIKDEPGWQQTINATGRPQSHPLQKLVAAFRVLAYGEAYDRTDEYVRLSRSTIEKATKSFIDFIVDTYEHIYLRRPNNEELAIILKRNAERGMPGCMGSIDCSHWTWRNCPRAHAGMYQGYKKKRSIVMETVCDEDLFIWHFFIGTPGSNNDLNVLRQSPLYFDVISGVWPPRTFDYTLNGRTRSLLYYLADGIYPQYAFFATPFATPQTPQDRTYNRLQEALRKDVERLYAVLTARFHVALHPARFRSVRRIILAGKAVAILHNMTVEQRRGSFLSRRRTGRDHGALAGGGGGAAGPDGGPAAMGGGPAAGGRGDGGGGGSAAGGGGPARGGGGGEGPLPAVSPAQDPPVGSFLFELRARAEATDADEFAALRDDLAAHIWEDRAAFLQPYL